MTCPLVGLASTRNLHSNKGIWLSESSRVDISRWYLPRGVTEHFKTTMIQLVVPWRNLNRTYCGKITELIRGPSIPTAAWRPFPRRCKYFCRLAIHREPHSTGVASGNKIWQYFFASVFPREIKHIITSVDSCTQFTREYFFLFFAASIYGTFTKPKGRFCSRHLFFRFNCHITKPAITSVAKNALLPGIIVSISGRVEATIVHVFNGSK